MRFSKYHGCGNSFVIVNESDTAGWDFSQLALAACSEPTGIGADGLIIVRTEPELEMVFYNRDGSRAPMCGNGIRCFARYCRDEGIRNDDSFTVKTLAGPMIVDIKSIEPFLVEINMGKPILTPDSCKIDTAKAGADAGKPFLKQMLDDGMGGQVQVSSIFMGTIHTVIWTEDLDGLDQVALGSHIESHPVYREKTNVNMVERVDDRTLKMRTFERGVGMTLACGTGACASVVIGIMENKCGKEVDVMLPLGTLHIRQSESGEIFMTGPAEKIAEGDFIGGLK